MRGDRRVGCGRRHDVGHAAQRVAPEAADGVERHRRRLRRRAGARRVRRPVASLGLVADRPPARRVRSWERPTPARA
ncbi:MAG: hypothetical protein AVDCRST_MAG11-3383 [uncultured Gemmatimonadaceae bacterium]|uniref:Uncharacterized protein n=1 Tax=uncultured Gemmatimonadaceae bacterium TaxID=246130 RepID=A0A6J4M512_9BACT|nr:MAG: hypothetical protein AVDCRST_MAG11-3383 [uncultured Gemmatimonadaceae bacterium]